MVSPPGPYGPLLETAGFRWIQLDMDRRSVHPARELGVLRRIAAIYRSEKPDIVHHFTIKCVVYGSLAAAWHGIRNRINAIEGMGYVYTSNDWFARLLRPFVDALTRHAVTAERSRLIVHNSDDLAVLNGAQPKAANVRLIMGAGIDTTLFRPAAECPEGTTRVLFASRLLRDKGLLEFVEAARELKHTCPDIDFLIAGTPDPGNPTSVSSDIVKAWHASGCITYLGHVDDIPALLRSVHLVVLPSYREGAPRILIEAAAAGLPVVATDVPGCRDVVEQGVNGLLVPVRQVAGLRDAIRLLHERPDERARMGNAARRKAIDEFDESIVFAKTFAVYGELLPASPSV